MKTDAQIQQDVMAQLKWNPLLNASEIGVAVKEGVVTLSGQVDSYQKKVAAEKEAQKVAGVKAIAEDIHVGLSSIFKRTDTEIAEAIVQTLKWHSSIPAENLKVKVEDGLVTLEGEAEWEFQRQAAKNAVSNLVGVRQVINNITLQKRIKPEDVKQKIAAAFHRSATIDAGRILVDVVGQKVILKGQVRSFAEKEEAEKAAWAAPGIFSVENQLEVNSIIEYAL